MRQPFLFGDRRCRVDEPLAWVEEYPIQWRDPKLDLGELARLRWIEGLSQKELARRLGRSKSGIQRYDKKLKQLGSRVPGLTAEERRKIKWALEN